LVEGSHPAGQRSEAPEFAEWQAEFGQEFLVHHAAIVGCGVVEWSDRWEAFDGEVVGGKYRQAVVPRPVGQFSGLLSSLNLVAARRGLYLRCDRKTEC
jgi:hypothetical protein